jgi:arylsulfatase A-like enzyme
MTHIDHQVNRLIEQMPEYGVSENTWICFLSDHGEMMGDHHLFRKSFPYQGAVRIPLIIKGPMGETARKASTLDQVVELRDIMPTLLDCAGLEIPVGVDGMSLLPLLRGEKIPWREYIHGEHPVFDTSSHWLTNGKEKYIWWSGCGTEQLFNLAEDPQELRDLAVNGGRPGQQNAEERLDFWREIMVKELETREEGFSDGKKLIPGRPVTACLSNLTGRSEIKSRSALSQR